MKMKFLALLSLCLFSVSAFAVTTANSIITAQTPNRGESQFLQGTDTAGTYKTLYTGAANGSIVKAIFATTSDGTNSHLITCQVVTSAVKYGGTTVTLPVSSGFAGGVPPVNIMSPGPGGNWPGLPIDSDGNPYINLLTGDTLQCTFATALTTSTLINLYATASDY